MQETRATRNEGALGPASSWLRGSLPPLRQSPQAQRIELDEASRVLVVVSDGAFLEGDEILVVERVRAVTADHMDAALVELEPHAPCDHLLALVDEDLQHLALGREPETVVDELCVFGHQLVFEMRGAAVERDRFDGAVRREQDRAPGRLVHAARLHANEAVFDQVKPSDAIVVAELVEGSEQRRRAHRLAVDRHWIALLETDLDNGRLVRRVLGMNGARINIR